MSLLRSTMLTLGVLAIAGCSVQLWSTGPSDSPGTATAAKYQVSTLYTGTPSVGDGFKGITLDGSGNLYVADRGGCAIHKITPQGAFSTLAGGERGYVDAKGAQAKFHYPEDLVFAPDRALYVADSYNHRIRKVTLDGEVTTYAGSTDGKADGALAEAQFSIPSGITADPSGTFYVTDNNIKIRKLAGGAVSTYPTQFWGNRGMAVGTNGKLYFTTNVNYLNTVTILDPQSGDHTVLAGKGESGFADGKGEQAQFAGPSGIAVDPQGTIFVVDSGNHRIRRITPDGTVTTIAGSTAGNSDGSGAEAKFNRPIGIVRDSAGNLYVTDLGNAAIRKLTPQP